ncbi:MAG: polysaccharide deacetylase [Alphaproteobacteria bacterium]|nr:polysaccharide deacetylase [Alphaproteobacteria bacterium]
MLSYHDRCAYSAIVDRPVYDWPNGARLAVYIAINIEHFPFGEGEGGQLIPGEPMPNVRAWSWRDYGNRVGIWNLLELCTDLDLPVCVNLNSEIYDYCPEVVTPFRERGDEIVAHGRSNGERQVRFRESDEAALIREATDAFVKHEGAQPQGWLGPYFSQSGVTPDLLKEAGYVYTMDWHNDDQPYWLDTRAGKLLNVPYPPETNDATVIQHRMGSAADFADQIVEEFDEMLRMSKQRPLVYSAALHTFLVGRPLRLRHLRRAFQHIKEHADDIWLTRPGDIARHVMELPAGTVPGSEVE